MKVLRFIGKLLLAVVILLAATICYGFISGGSKLGHKYAMAGEPLQLPTDSTSLARGERLSYVFGCKGCHGMNLSGRVLFDDPAFGRWIPPNLTPSKFGRGEDYTAADWSRAVRDGIHKDGRAIAIMPCEDFHYMSDTDLGQIVAYIKTVPAVDSARAPSQVGPLARILVGLGQIKLPADIIHHGQRPTPPAPGPTVEYGEYMSRTCRGCHGQNLAGGEGHGGPAPPNLTPGGDLRNWTAEGFAKAVRNGLTPTGRQLNPDEMPWTYFAHMTDDEVNAVWAYLRTVPAVAPRK